MQLFAALDVSVRTTSICVMDDRGKILSETKVESDPEQVSAKLSNLKGYYVRVGLE